MFMVARLDGRSFTRLTQEVRPFEVPFDPTFLDMMIVTTEHCMNCGFRVVFGHTQSDEISLVLHRDESSFGRKVRKIDSVLAGEASAKFSILLGHPASFDCRISQLPNLELVLDYLRWRYEDARRNALNVHCYWALRRLGQSKRDAARRLERISVGEKIELLSVRAGIDFSDLPSWQKRGVGFSWLEYRKGERGTRTTDATTAIRRRIIHHMELPEGDEYAHFARRIILAEHPDIPN
jgi:tRNA(His) guanylyltransferase